MKNLIWYFLILIFAFCCGWDMYRMREVRAAEKYNASLAQLGEGVEVYRVVDENTTCYVAIGRLHGYTVAIDCVKEK